MNGVIDLNSNKDVKLELKESLLKKEAHVTIIGKRASNKKLIMVNKSPYNWLIFEGSSKFPYSTIETLLDIDLNDGLDTSKIRIFEFNI